MRWGKLARHMTRPCWRVESDGCLVAPAVFKTVVPALGVGRSVQFAPSPPPRCGQAL